MRGCLLVLLPEEYATEPQSFIEILAACRVTRITLVPSLLRTFLLAFPDLDARLPLLQIWTVSGEALPSDLANDFLAACPGHILINLYGSTEVAGDVTCWSSDSMDVSKASRDGWVSIGKPIKKCGIEIVDSDLFPVSDGEPGEVAITGANNATGYYNNPEETSKRFVTLPGIPGGRGPCVAFRSGDIGIRDPASNGPPHGGSDPLHGTSR